MEASYDLSETPNVLKKSDLRAMHYSFLSNTPDFGMTTRNTVSTCFANEMDVSSKSTGIYAPALRARLSFESEYSPDNGGSVPEAFLIHQVSAVHSTMNATNTKKTQSSAIAGGMHRYQNIQPHPSARSLQGPQKKPRKRNPDPIRALLPGPNRYGRRGTLKCQLCRRWRLKVFKF